MAQLDNTHDAVAMKLLSKDAWRVGNGTLSSFPIAVRLVV